MISIPKNPSPVFIVSSGRSGTTLLRSILNSSEELYIPHESDFIARAFKKFGDKEDYTKKDYLQLIKIFKMESQADGWNMDLNFLLAELEKQQPRSFAEVNEVIYNSFLKSKNYKNKRWGIKAPVLIASLDVIFKVFPGAKIIHLIRDGRDVCLSYKQVHKSEDTQSFGPKSTLANALYWVDGLRRIEKFSGHNIFELRYEDLVLDTENSLKRLCDFIEITYLESMVTDFFKNTNTGLTSKEKKTIHKNVGKPILKSNVNKYKKYMEKKERFLYEILSYPYLRKYGYIESNLLLRNFLFSMMRFPFYQSARFYNNWRYSLRDKRLYKLTTA